MERKELPSFFAIVGAEDDYEGKEEEVYSKKDADAVMDAYEERIKELEDKLYGNNGETTKLLIKLNSYHSERQYDVNLVNDCYVTIHQQMERIKELEADNAKKLRQIENGMKGTKALEARIKELEVKKAELKYQIENFTQGALAATLEMKLYKANERIKELETRLDGYVSDSIDKIESCPADEADGSKSQGENVKTKENT